MPSQLSTITDEKKIRKDKQAALRYLLDAWEEAVYDGVDPDVLSSAAIFTALSDMVATYGEEAVSNMTDGLSQRIKNGEFTVDRILQ